MKRCFVFPFILIVISVNAMGMEYNINRQGKDYAQFDLKKADPEMCRTRCLADSKCKAWTFVKPNTIHGPTPRCLLKYTVPPPMEDPCCVSGIKQQSSEDAYPAEHNTIRPGFDYLDFDMHKPELKRCWNRCKKDPKCKAYTFVPPGIQGPNARCWLKYSVPPPKKDPCCVSGVK